MSNRDAMSVLSPALSSLRSRVQGADRVISLSSDEGLPPFSLRLDTPAGESPPLWQGPFFLEAPMPIDTYIRKLERQNRRLRVLLANTTTGMLLSALSGALMVALLWLLEAL